MSDLFILYLVFTYLYSFGVVIASWQYKEDEGISGIFLWVMFAPITTPIVMGMGIGSGNT